MVTDGLIMHVDPLNTLSEDGTVTVTDLIGDYDLTKQNTPSNLTSADNSWDFDGVNECIGTSAAAPWINRTGFSMGGWAYPTDNVADGTVVGGWSGGFDEFLLWWDVGGTPNFRLIAKNALLTSVSTSDVTACGTVATWNHVYVTWGASNVKLYLNGVLNQTVSNGSQGTIGTSTGGGWSIGHQRYPATGSARYFDGAIGPISAYDRELTAAEVTQNYNATKNRFL